MGFVNRLKKKPDLLKIDFFDSGTLVKTDEQIRGSSRRDHPVHVPHHLLHHPDLSDPGSGAFPPSATISTSTGSA